MNRDVLGLTANRLCQPKVSIMKRGICLLSRAFAVAMLLSAGMIPPSTTSARTPTTQTGLTQGIDAVAHRYEVRLRKLHLVRPDLILYPICYDVYC